MATDLLIGRLGQGAIERALVEAGHHDPKSMTPFPTMHEMFSVGWGQPNLRDQWRTASPAARAQLLEQTNSRPYEPDPEAHPLAGVGLRSRVVRQRRGHLPGPCQAAAQRRRPGRTGA